MERSNIIIPYMYAITIRTFAMIRNIQYCGATLYERSNGGACIDVVNDGHAEEKMSGLDTV